MNELNFNQKDFFFITSLNENTYRDYSKSRGGRPAILNLGTEVNQKRKSYSLIDCLKGRFFYWYSKSDFPLPLFPIISNSLDQNVLKNALDLESRNIFSSNYQYEHLAPIRPLTEIEMETQSSLIGKKFNPQKWKNYWLINLYEPNELNFTYEIKASDCPVQNESHYTGLSKDFFQAFQIWGGRSWADYAIGRKKEILFKGNHLLHPFDSISTRTINLTNIRKELDLKIKKLGH